MATSITTSQPDSSPPQKQLEHLEAELVSARSDVDDSRDNLNDARLPLQAAEKEVRKCWAKRKAWQGSLRATENAIRAAGLSRTLSTSISIARIQKQIEEAAAEIRSIILSSEAICQVFEVAWDLYATARLAEKRALEAIASFQPERLKEEPVMLRRRQRARAELEELEVVRVREAVQRRKDFALDSDGHYDPNYDEREILLRRMRPWV